MIFPVFNFAPLSAALVYPRDQFPWVILHCPLTARTIHIAQKVWLKHLMVDHPKQNVRKMKSKPLKSSTRLKLMRLAFPQEFLITTRFLNDTLSGQANLWLMNHSGPPLSKKPSKASLCRKSRQLLFPSHRVAWTPSRTWASPAYKMTKRQV